MLTRFMHQYLFLQTPLLGPLWIGLALLAFGGDALANSSAGGVTLAWDASTAAGLGGYKVHYGTSSGNYAANVDVGAQTTYPLSGLQEGATYYFAVTAYDFARTTESGYSNEVSATIPTTVKKPTADFTASQTSGYTPLTMNFTPTVTGSITSWQWDFGDGTTSDGAASAVPAAMKSYASEGTYSASLTVTGPGGSVTKTKPVTVIIFAPPRKRLR